MTELGIIKEEIWLGEYSTVEELQDAVQWYWSGSRTNSYLGCFRKGQHAYEEAIALKGDGASPPLVVGGALHSALANYYGWGGKEFEDQDALLEQTLAILRAEIDNRGGLPLTPTDDKNHHLTTGHVEIIMKYYFKWAKVHDAIKPVVLHQDQINWEKVIGARLRVLPDGRIVLGESAFIMRLEVDTPWEGKVDFIYSGIPDLPVEMPTGIYVMDHKSTGSYLGKWYFSQYRFDTSLRIYCVMMKSLLKKSAKKIEGILINGLHTGKGASNHKFKGTRFLRYGPIDYFADHYKEALLNQAATIRMQEFLNTELGGYFPQSTGIGCRNCSMAKLCTASPNMRAATILTEYEKKNVKHLLEIK